ncbi:MAG: hypothetical protein ACTSWM_04860 [Alphaproteobacteria bacterium]
MSSDNRTADQRHAGKMRGIQGAGKALREQAAKAGNPITQTQAEARVRKAVNRNANKRRG